MSGGKQKGNQQNKKSKSKMGGRNSPTVGASFRQICPASGSSLCMCTTWEKAPVEGEIGLFFLCVQGDTAVGGVGNSASF